MFCAGDLVVYGRSGICEVTEVTTMKMDGVPKDRLYYILELYRDKAGRIFTPVDNQKVVMRSVISEEEATALIDRMPEIEELWITNDKLREAKYKECMNTCQCIEWIKIIKTLYLRRQQRVAQGKKITAIDERYLKMAEGSLYAELSIALGIPENEMEAYIINRLEEQKESV